MSSRSIRSVAIPLVCAAISLFASPAAPAAPAETEEEFLEEVRAAAGRHDEAALREIVATRPLVTYEWFDGLLRGERPEDTATAARLARFYDETFGDDALLRRVRLFEGWSAEQRAAHAEALAIKEAAKGLLHAGRLEESRTEFRRALERFERLGDPRMQAYCLLNIGATLSFEGRLSEALESFGRARERAGQAGDRAIIAYIENNRAYALIDLGDLDAARQALLAALPISREAGERRVEAGISMMLGTIAVSLGNLADAKQRFLQGRELADALGDPELASVAWKNLAVIHASENDHRAAESALRHALAAARTLGAPRVIAAAELDLAELEQRRGDGPAARERLSAARQVAAGVDDPALHSRIELLESEFAVQAQRFDKALDHLARAESAIEGTDVRSWLYDVHRSRARVHFVRGDYENAFASASRALAAAEATSDLSARADAHYLLAYLHNSVGEVGDALREIQVALRLAEQAGDTGERAGALQLLGLYRSRIGDYAGAREAFSDALRLTDREAEPESHAYLLLSLASAELHQGAGHEDAARHCVDGAREIGVAIEDRDVLAAADLLDIELALRLGNIEAAQGTLARARRLDPALIEPPERWRIHHLEGQAREMQGREEAALAAYRRAVEEVERLRSGLHAVAGRAAALEDRILPYRSLLRLYLKQGRLEEAYLTARMAKARTFVEKLNPVVIEEFANFRPPVTEALIPGEIVPLARLKSALRAGEALLDFFLTEDAVIVFVVRRDRFSMTPIPLEGVNLAGLIESVRHPGRPVDEEAGVTRAFEAAAEQLGGLLLGPLEREIRDARSLFVVPNAELHRVPYAALRYGGKQLVREHAVAVLPAAGLLVRARGRGKAGAGPALVVGDPTTDSRLARLPGADREARRVAAILGESATLLLGQAAREEAIRAGAEEAPVIHLAAHARVDPVFPANSFVALAPGKGEDGRWTAEEIAKANLRAFLVTLSGCRTALDVGLGNPAAPGDEREGLVRAFLKAGAGSIVANLWETDDAVAQVVLPELYRRMAGLSPLQALSELQRDMLDGALEGPDGQSLAHPFYWAGLVAYEPGLGGLQARRAR